jgi:hypothetical protein
MRGKALFLVCSLDRTHHVHAELRQPNPTDHPLGGTTFSGIAYCFRDTPTMQSSLLPAGQAVVSWNEPSLTPPTRRGAALSLRPKKPTIVSTLDNEALRCRGLEPEG